MSQHYVPGPCSIAIGPYSGNLEHLGWAQDGVIIAIQPHWESVYSDILGPIVPEDVQFMGADAVIRFVGARINDSVLAKARAILPGTSEGQWAARAIGTLLLHEGYNWRMLLQFPYQAKAAHSGQRAAYNFPFCYPSDSIETSNSVRASRPRMTWRANPFIQSATGSAVLFNADTTGAPVVGLAT